MIRSVIRSFIPIFIFLVVWQLVAFMVSTFRGVPFPTPWTTFMKLTALLGGQTLSDHTLYRHLADSIVRWLAGFVMAAIAGVVYGLFAGWWRPLESRNLLDHTYPPVDPRTGLDPRCHPWFLVSVKPQRFFMITMTAFPPVAINVLNGVKRLDTTFVRAAQMMGAGQITMLFKVLLPGAMPSIISGLRIGLGNGWRVLVAAEMIVGAGTGLGYSIIQARWTLDYASAFACLCVICVIGLLIEHLVFNPLEKRTVERWSLQREE